MGEALAHGKFNAGLPRPGLLVMEQLARDGMTAFAVERDGRRGC